MEKDNKIRYKAPVSLWEIDYYCIGSLWFEWSKIDEKYKFKQKNKKKQKQ